MWVVEHPPRAAFAFVQETFDIEIGRTRDERRRYRLARACACPRGRLSFAVLPLCLRAPRRVVLVRVPCRGAGPKTRRAPPRAWRRAL